MVLYNLQWLLYTLLLARYISRALYPIKMEITLKGGIVAVTTKFIGLCRLSVCPLIFSLVDNLRVL